MKYRGLLIAGILLLLLVASMTLTGCAGNKVILHPIDKVDIVVMKTGIPYTPEKDGYFLSNYYLKKIVGAEVDK